MPQFYEFDPGHADGIRREDLLEGELVPKELIYECERSLEGIEHAKLDLEMRGLATERGVDRWDDGFLVPAVDGGELAQVHDD